MCVSFNLEHEANQYTIFSSLHIITYLGYMYNLSNYTIHQFYDSIDNLIKMLCTLKYHPKHTQLDFTSVILTSILLKSQLINYNIVKNH